MRRLLAVTLGCAALAAVPAVAQGANPPGTGQPSQQCGSAGATSAPKGFSTGGFANAESHYANGSGHNVSQYDVACFQQTSAGH